MILGLNSNLVPLIQSNYGCQIWEKYLILKLIQSYT